MLVVPDTPQRNKRRVGPDRKASSRSGERATCHRSSIYESPVTLTQTYVHAQIIIYGSTLFSV